MTPKETAEIIVEKTASPHTLKDLAQAYLSLLAESEKMRAALKWYAHPDNQCDDHCGGDGGERARKALLSATRGANDRDQKTQEANYEN